MDRSKKEMLKLHDKIDILMHYFKYGESIKKISRKTGISRNTIRSYIKEYEERREILIKDNKEADTETIINSILDRKAYKSCNRNKLVMNDIYIEKIKKFLSDNKYKEQNGLRKQCMTAQDIHEELLNLGYTGSYPTTVIYVRSLKESTKEAFIKQVYEYGEICEFDWGVVKLREGEKITKYYMAVFTSAKTNYRISYLYRREDTQAFIDSHARFFERVDGVYMTMVYDNMKVAVAKFVGINEKEPTEALKKLSLFYGFKFRFCSIYAGNEKGHVERSVDVIRRKAFSHCIDYSLKEAESRLEKVLIKINCNKLLEEKPFLLPYPGKYETAEIRECFVDKYSAICFSNNRYSVPDHLVGKYVILKAYVEKLVILYKKNIVATHKRLHCSKEWQLNIYHYIRTISRKPGSLKGSLAFRQMQSNLKEIYTNYFLDMPKEFIKVLKLIGDNGEDKVFNAIDILRTGSIFINFDNIMSIVSRRDDIVDNDAESIKILSSYDDLYSKGRL